MQNKEFDNYRCFICQLSMKEYKDKNSLDDLDFIACKDGVIRCPNCFELYIDNKEKLPACSYDRLKKENEDLRRNLKHEKSKLDDMRKAKEHFKAIVVAERERKKKEQLDARLREMEEVYGKPNEVWIGAGGEISNSNGLNIRFTKIKAAEDVEIRIRQCELIAYSIAKKEWCDHIKISERLYIALGEESKETEETECCVLSFQKDCESCKKIFERLMIKR